MDPSVVWWTDGTAPPRLQFLGPFLNSVDERAFGAHRPQDRITDPEALSRWLAAHGLVQPGSPAGETDLVDALRLRAALREAAAANQRTGGSASDSGALAEVADRLPLRIRIAPDGGVDLEPAAPGEVRGALARLAADAVLATADGTWRRVKMCAAPDCRVIFYDGSKPRTGRWCATSVCGNRVKTRRYRQRVSPAGPGAASPSPAASDT
ncbi:CGNR zinc finger domain-containing protein [Frankia sp. AgKG'84/4]|uniref:CGNR zinc finger domain-containing protein n=1 Tax=Frankia sp. AgKG'84/4 TaxID=573490 RepID=UPI00200F70A0|nr:CGNR zinc finger domain-containing protein [Frankia sp. AgKG'84/4]MCL9792740.1 CGNR zinc finger domain-containing protein [Frankia sp. AgKG'84/4]